jgi:hypothetical protein
MEEDLFKIVGIIIVGFFVIYMVLKMFKLQKSVVEGLTNPDSSGPAPVSGEAGTAAEYAAGLKARLVKLQDELLVAKYRKDYESAIINLDDYIGYLMIQQTLNMKLDGEMKTQIESINNLNILKNAKESLNSTMAFLDKQ